MSFHRVCVCLKKIVQPLLRRALISANEHGGYELTPSGKKAAEQAIKDNVGKHLTTYGGISIGTEVWIVQE